MENKEFIPYIIKINNYLLLVDDSEIKDACYVYKDHEQEIGKGIFYIPNDIDFKAFNAEKSNTYIIKAHLPLNNSPILEGVDLLPPQYYNKTYGK